MSADSGPLQDRKIDWRLCTWDGARRAQLQAFRRLSLHHKLEAVEQWCDLIRDSAARRQARGQDVVADESLEPLARVPLPPQG